MRFNRMSIACALALGTSTVAAHAQSVDSLNIIRTPLSPAFALMGISPVAIERPTTPRAFALSLLSATEDFARLPESWAVEVAPFWLKPRPLFRYQDFYNADMGTSFAQILSISVATTRRDTATRATDVGIGFRAQPVAGGESSISVAYRDSIRQVQQRTVRANSARRAAERAAAAATTDAVRQRQQEIADSLSGVIDALADSARTFAQKLNQNQERVGFSLDLAGAWNFGFPTDDFQGGKTAGVRHHHIRVEWTFGRHIRVQAYTRHVLLRVVRAGSQDRRQQSAAAPRQGRPQSRIRQSSSTSSLRIDPMGRAEG
jgi:hypothetical protein